MKNASAESKRLLLVAMVIALTSASALNAAEKSWKDETVLVSKQGDQAVVRKMNNDKVLFQNKDAQLAVEWAMSNARATLVQAGNYMIDDSIDAPRDGVTLIIDQGAVIEMNLDADPKTNIGFRSRLGPNAQQLAPIIYIKDRNNVRVYYFGDLVHGKKKKPEGSKQPFVQTFPVVFDGRNPKRTCGVDGGTIVATGTIHNAFVCLDSKNMQAPLICPVPSGGDGVFCMEGCDDGAIGMVVNLAKEKGGACGETVDLNACNSNIKIETLIGERANEIIDCNASQADIEETISIGRSPTLFDLTPNSGNRWTSRPRAPKRLTCKKLTVLSGDDPAKVGLVKGRNRKNRLALVVDIGDLKTKEKPPAEVKIGEVTFLAEAVDVKRTISIPKLPEALPKFDVTATVEVTLKDGAKKTYTKTVSIDITK